MKNILCPQPQMNVMLHIVEPNIIYYINIIDEAFMADSDIKIGWIRKMD